MEELAMKRHLFVLGIVTSAFAACAKTVFIEAESFDDWGGWVNDTQFMDQMGSPYLLAHGMGKPVADAKTKFIANGWKYSHRLRCPVACTIFPNQGSNLCPLHWQADS